MYSLDAKLLAQQQAHERAIARDMESKKWVARTILAALVGGLFFLAVLRFHILKSQNFCYQEYCPSGYPQRVVTRCSDPLEDLPAKGGLCSDGNKPTSTLLCSMLKTVILQSPICVIVHTLWGGAIYFAALVLIYAAFYILYDDLNLRERVKL
jgi:hypothetical protein